MVIAMILVKAKAVHRAVLGLSPPMLAAYAGSVLAVTLALDWVNCTKLNLPLLFSTSDSVIITASGGL